MYMFQPSRIGLDFFVALISVVTVGCSQRGDNSEQLVSKVQNVLRSDQRLMMARLQVTGVHSIITIRGYVVDDVQRAAAVQDVWRVEGVNVRDQIEDGVLRRQVEMNRGIAGQEIRSRSATVV